jgi:toxin ParE1/3/4
VAPVVWTEPALRDLEEIHGYIAAESGARARSMMSRIVEAASTLAAFPESGGSLPELPHLPYRRIVVRPYLLIYRFDEVHNRVLIMAVIHGARDLPALFEDR